MKIPQILLPIFVAVLTAQAVEQPNLLIIHTDEHNFRTLGAYRELLTEDQAYIWGEGVKVETPHIDRIAHEGAICTSYYATSPVCTPSRASIMTGLYPQVTGAPKNNRPMNDEVVTFAEVLRRNGYATSYVGKWHLDGDEKPGFEPARKFGFEDNRYMFNRGHWKLFHDAEHGPELIGEYNTKKESYKYDIHAADETSFATDFLVDRTLEIIDRDKSKPFCVMLSLPDPHGPNTVRAPYDTMYTHFKYEDPRTMRAGLASNPKLPGWAKIAGKNTNTKLNQNLMAQYFGMVKCIDDNVGKILKYLEDEGLSENTIVVFTSDHGDLMGEHCRDNKGLPYETSAGIAFMIRYPGTIPAGKIVNKANTNADFAPTVLSLMGVTEGWPEFHGQDLSDDYTSADSIVDDDRVVYLRNANGAWLAAVSDRYKLVYSYADSPWLFDLEKDPDELINFYSNPEYAPIAKKLTEALLKQAKAFKEPKVNLIKR